MFNLQAMKISFKGAQCALEPLAAPESGARASVSPGRQRFEALYRSGEPLALVLFEIDNFSSFMHLFGPQAGQSMSSMAGEELRTQAGGLLNGSGDWLLEDLGEGRSYLLLAGEEAREHRLPDLCFSLRTQLRGRLKKEAVQLSGQILEVRAGFAQLSGGVQSLEAALYSALCDAQRVARGQIETDQLPMLAEFRDIIAARRITSVFQPLVELESGDIFAWEALTRGPAGSFFQQPTVLFDFAEDVDQVFTLERACRESAIATLGAIGPEQRLFLNVHPRSLVSPDFSPGQTLEMLQDKGLRPEQVVLEITERHCIQDFTLFHRTLDHYRSQGFQVAVDDVGTGYSGLWSIAELRPEFIKIDMSLVRNVDTNPVKRALLETFVAFADKIGSRLIAEGIETESELTTVMHLGVHLGQGYFLARPAYPKVLTVPPLPSRNDLRQRLGGLAIKCSIPLRELCEPATVVEEETQVFEVRKILTEDNAPGAVVVVNGRRPLGLVMKHALDQALSTQYGLALYFRRPVTRIMDETPLVVESDTPAETVAQLAMGRDRAKLYDHVVVTDRGRLYGIASVQRLLDALAAVQVEMAKGASPLTGLPGNLQIERELEDRADVGRPFSIIYCDLDNFKAYNDTYGFSEGDQIILLCSRIMLWAIKRHGASDDFAGHLGGDDFVAVVGPVRAERICKAMVRVFGRLILNYYNSQDRANGCIMAKDRAGQFCRFPLVSLSLAIVEVRGPTDLESIGHRAAEVKRFAKSMPGNAYVRDRRAPLGL